MPTRTPTQMTALGAQAAANQFLSEHLPDRFTADLAQRAAAGDLWRVPVILAYPIIGSVGQVGEILINSETEQITSHTPVEEMKRRAQTLYETHHEQIEAAFS
ncbi:MAG: hypothetical protein ACRD9R_04900 [Pyrinomonadaceae bacterium]